MYDYANEIIFYVFDEPCDMQCTWIHDFLTSMVIDIFNLKA